MLEPTILTEPTNMDRAFVYLVSMSVLFLAHCGGAEADGMGLKSASVCPSVHTFKHVYH